MAYMAYMSHDSHMSITHIKHGISFFIITIEQVFCGIEIVHFCHATMKELVVRLENPCHAEDPRSCLAIQNQTKKP